MDTTEPTETEFTPNPGLVLTNEAQSYLLEAGKWTKFLAIMGFIFCGLILLAAIFVGTLFSIMSKFSPGGQGIPEGIGGVLSGFYIVIDVLYFFFPYYLYQF